jgi:hypothetical protein
MWVRRGGIDQLDFQAHDGVQASLPCGSREAHRAVEALVIGHRQPGKAQLHGPVDQVISRRRSIQEREL